MIQILLEGPIKEEGTGKCLWRVTKHDDIRGTQGSEYLSYAEPVAEDLAQRMSRDRRLPLKDIRKALSNENTKTPS